MRIINLIENTEGPSGCAYAHGLSFYVETKKHRMLLDLGPSGQTLQNAQVLGVFVRDIFSEYGKMADIVLLDFIRNTHHAFLLLSN